jgi:hypothetical protein
VVWSRNVNGYFCAPLRGSFCDDTDDGVFGVVGTEKSVADFARLAGSGGGEGGVVVGGVGFEGAQGVALGGGEGDVAGGGGVGDTFFGGRGVEA